MFELNFHCVACQQTCRYKAAKDVYDFKTSFHFQTSIEITEPAEVVPLTASGICSKSTPRKTPKDQSAKPKSSHGLSGSSVDATDIGKEAVASECWTEKYGPKSIGQLVGQGGEKSPVRKLLAWLSNWAKSHLATDDKRKGLSLGAVG